MMSFLSWETVNRTSTVPFSVERFALLDCFRTYIQKMFDKTPNTYYSKFSKQQKKKINIDKSSVDMTLEKYSRQGTEIRPRVHQKNHSSTVQHNLSQVNVQNKKNILSTRT